MFKIISIGIFVFAVTKPQLVEGLSKHDLTSLCSGPNAVVKLDVQGTLSGLGSSGILTVSKNSKAHLTNAIDAFLMTIKNNQPPKVFVGHSKFIIIGAHKLVYIGDTVYRNLDSSELKTRVMHKSNSLCDSLKTLVNSTKKAASEFPSVVAVQEMVDSVVDVSHLANGLKMSMMN